MRCTSGLLQMVLSLLNQMLEVAEKSAAGRGSRRSGGSSQRGARTGGSGGGLRLPDFGGAGSGEEDEEEEGKQELLALMQKLKVRAGGWARLASSGLHLGIACGTHKLACELE